MACQNTLARANPKTWPPAWRPTRFRHGALNMNGHRELLTGILTIPIALTLDVAHLGVRRRLVEKTPYFVAKDNVDINSLRHLNGCL